jgi:hypothetical protein
MSEEVGTGVNHGGAQTPQERHVPDARRPLKHFVDYVAGNKLDRLELLFGPVTVQIWIWVNYENCSFRDALQILFKDPDHWSTGLGNN